MEYYHCYWIYLNIFSALCEGYFLSNLKTQKLGLFFIINKATVIKLQKEHKMSLWGTRDNITGPSPVTVVGTASSNFWTASAAGLSASGIATGTSALLDDGESGFVTLEAEISTDLYRVGKMSAVAAGTYPATYATQPIYLKNDPGYAPSAANTTTGISTIRTQVLAGVSTAGVAAAGLTTTTGGFHAGWVGIMTYIDMHGNLRTKTETFVAQSGIATGNRPYPTT